MSWLTKVLGLDDWKQQVIADIDAHKDEAIQNIVKEWVDRRIHELRPGAMYIVQVSERSTREECDAVRQSIESMGAYCVVVAADSMQVLSFTTKA